MLQSVVDYAIPALVLNDSDKRYYIYLMAGRLGACCLEEKGPGNFHSYLPQQQLCQLIGEQPSERQKSDHSSTRKMR